jgi:ATP-binding cassette subfamily B protein/ATP-binding cassette subfamily C protein/ATP-binding cassette subfamily B multidrug efflux pump
VPARRSSARRTAARRGAIKVWGGREGTSQARFPLAELRGHTTVIAIAHRLSTIRAADQIVVLNHGRIAECGTHDVLLAIPGGIYQRLWQLQQIGD